MRYYVTSDTHGFYTQLMAALQEAGYFEDKLPHKLLILGDLFDRGKEALKMQEFILNQMKNDSVILIKGNHEDLYKELVTIDNGVPYEHHISNGTYDTALQLTGLDAGTALKKCHALTVAGTDTPYFKEIIPAMLNYYETEHYVFTHGWIPCIADRKGYSPITNWREASEQEWLNSRWYNGMDAAWTETEDKTIVCGHWHTSYGHSRYEGNGSEFDEDADFSPYYGPRVIAVDACTAQSGKVNCIVIED